MRAGPPSIALYDHVVSQLQFQIGLVGGSDFDPESGLMIIKGYREYREAKDVAATVHVPEYVIDMRADPPKVWWRLCSVEPSRPLECVIRWGEGDHSVTSTSSVCLPMRAGINFTPHPLDDAALLRIAMYKRATAARLTLASLGGVAEPPPILWFDGTQVLSLSHRGIAGVRTNGSTPIFAFLRNASVDWYHVWTRCENGQLVGVPGEDAGELLTLALDGWVKWRRVAKLITP